MPLDPAGLAGDLAALAADPPPDIPGCAQAWADAMESYASEMVPPSPSLSAACSALSTALAGAFGSPLAAPGMEAAFTAFGAAVASTLPDPVAPPGPVGFATQFALPHPTTHAAAGAALSGIIDTWMRTGTSADVFWS